MDALCLKTGINGIAPSISVGGALEVRANATQQISGVGRSPADKSTGASSSQKTAPSRFFSFRYPLKLWPGLRGSGGGGGGGGKTYKGIALDDAVLAENGEKAGVEAISENEMKMRTSYTKGQNGNWVLKILHVGSLWKQEEKQGQESKKEEDVSSNNQMADNHDDDDGDDCLCRVDGGDDDDEKVIEFDRDSFSRLLKRVSLAEAKLYAQMSYLSNLAYAIPKIKAGNLLKYRGLRFITSSIDKKELAAAQAEKTQTSSEKQETDKKPEHVSERKDQKNNGYGISAFAAYQIAASAASYLHSRTKSILPFTSSGTDGVGENSLKRNMGGDDVMNSDVASFMATTDSVTAVVAAKEEVKQAVADDLKSALSSPCEWFICDDDLSGTRFFAIQGSESLASWQANLLFEPIQFEGLDILVHRGIYEAAKGIYEQILPEVRAHMEARGDNAYFRFTGHSLGGSLSLLVNLMLLIRGEVPASCLLPVITFGAPSIMCGGDNLLRKLGLPQNHVQAITMHRDIVPRAFSCNYPNHVAELLKAVNGNFRNHPCLNNQKLLYSPMGEILILQPDEKMSPHHHLLPSGSGLYLLCGPLSNTTDPEKHLRAAKRVFFNSPHPLEILSDRGAYGSEGTVQRDHDMNSYLKSVRLVLRQEMNRKKKAKREHQHHRFWWPLVLPSGISGGIIMEGTVGPAGAANGRADQLRFAGMLLQTGRASLKRFSRLVASQHMHLFVVVLFPARLLLLGAYSVMGFS